MRPPATRHAIDPPIPRAPPARRAGRRLRLVSRGRGCCRRWRAPTAVLKRGRRQQPQRTEPQRGDEDEDETERRRREERMNGLGQSFVATEGVVEEVSLRDAEYDYLGETTAGDLQIFKRLETRGINVLGLKSVDDVLDVEYGKLHKSTQGMLDTLGVPLMFPEGQPQRGIYCSRTLNFRSIKCIGYDMDYTLIHYDVNSWEGRAYEYGLKNLKEAGYPTEGLEFDPNLVVRGLVVDKELGNLVKMDRFGIPRRAMHGTRMLTMEQLKDTYGRETVNLRNEDRWYFINTFFSVSEANLYMQMVDRLDQERIPMGVGVHSYESLHDSVAQALYRCHVEGILKDEIIQDPGKYVEVDQDTPQALLDQRDAGKMLLLITNSEYDYTNRMMSFAFDPYLPGNMTWRDLFDMVIFQARKPDFFTYNMSLYEVVTPDGLMKPSLKANIGGLYCGGSARMVEKALGVEGDEVLYVGDHIYTDAALAKLKFKWRTALIVRELEQEINAVLQGQDHREELQELISKKEIVGDLFNQLRLRRLSNRNCKLDQIFTNEEDLNSTLAQLLMVMTRLDEEIGKMLDQEGEHFNKIWGYLCRTGLHDKSALTRQIEKWADIYTSRVSNFRRYTPFMYFRSTSQSLAHDRRVLELNEDSEFLEQLWRTNGASKNGGDY